MKPQKFGPSLPEESPGRMEVSTSRQATPGWQGLLSESLGLLLVTAVWMHVLIHFPVHTQDIPMLCVDGRQIAFSLNLIPLNLAAVLEAAYPPLVYLFTLPFYLVLGLNPTAAFLSITVQTALLAPATYLLARSVTGPAGAWFAYLLTAASTVALAFSGAYFPDQMTSLLVPLLLASWFASRGLTRSWPSVLFGVLLGLGLLVKLTFLLFTWVALLDAAWQALRHPDRLRLDSRPVLLFLGTSLAVFLLWFSMSKEDFLVCVLAGELALILLMVWLVRHLRAESSRSVQKGCRLLLALTLAFGLAGPYYSVSLNRVMALYATYEMWVQNAPELSHLVGPLNFQVPLFPGVAWLLPLGLLTLFLHPRVMRRNGILIAEQLALGYLALMVMDLDYEPVMIRYLVHAVPLAAALAGLGVLWLGRLAPLAPALLLIGLIHQYDPEEWVALRMGKAILTIADKPAPTFPESPVVRELVRRLQKRFPDRPDAEGWLVCYAWQDNSHGFEPNLGWPSHEFSAAMGIPFHRPLSRTLQVDIPLPHEEAISLQNPDYVLTVTRSSTEEMDLIRKAEVVLETRLVRLEGAAARDRWMTIWKVSPGRHGLQTDRGQSRATSLKQVRPGEPAPGSRRSLALSGTSTRDGNQQVYQPTLRATVWRTRTSTA
ncbi:MAG: ArnT family glycosyltransferase [Candidatus Xenobium sp.]|jgi:hypothetical protein